MKKEIADYRITPAYAGMRTGKAGSWYRIEDHPCVCRNEFYKLFYDFVI